MLIKKINDVPLQMLNDAVSEIDKINWDSIDDGRSKRTIAFASSKTIQIRIHKQPKQLYSNVHDWGNIVETENHPIHFKIFPNVINLANWVLDKVSGKSLGRVFVAKLDPQGIIHPHIDSGKYFEVHSRFHIPVCTTSNAVFLENLNDTENSEHMEKNCLYQLNNSVLHGFKNDCRESRIHLIIDIDLDRINNSKNFEYN